ncbi:MAG: protein-glutamate O-methyltransferase CheR [Clostridia bacterium]|nr:protein-glutamate O-methyltransferase CheR [Clostridia bacterium]
MEGLNHQVCKKYVDILRNKTGIYLDGNKEHLVQAKILKLLMRRQVADAKKHLQLIGEQQDKVEVQEFINIMTTNTTEFFRENNHFEYLKNDFPFILKKNPRINTNKELRIWSAGCSSGQEPVTIAMVFKELLSDEFDIRILATDISTKVLNKAASGVYSQNECQGIPKNFLLKYFSKTSEGYKVKEEILNMIKYRVFNLMNEYKFKHGFDIIFCRNVMIYFDQNTQQELVSRFHRAMVPGGLLLIGHSESLISKKHEFEYYKPSIYMKKPI